MANAKIMIAQTASLCFAGATAHAYGVNYHIVDIVCQEPLTGVVTTPELRSNTFRQNHSYGAKMADSSNNCWKTKYVVKGIGKKADRADERYPPNEENPVQMKRSLCLQALGIAGIIIPRFKR